MPLPVRILSGVVLVAIFAVLVMSVAHNQKKDRPVMALLMSGGALVGFLVVFLLTE